MIVSRWISLLLLAACSARAAHPVPLGVLALGDRAALGDLAATQEGLAVRVLESPPPPPEPADTVAAALARARTAYVRGQLDTCLGEARTIDTAELLVASDRGRAARALALVIACNEGATLHAEARAVATRFASYGLELPESTVAPDVEALIGAEVERVGRAPRARLAIATVTGARLRVDGRPAGCEAPCTVELAPGEHVVSAEADGFAAGHASVRVPDATQASIELLPATALLAAQQWRARLGRGQPATDAIGARLIGRFALEPRVAVLVGGPRVEGALIIDGRVVARNDAPTGAAGPLLRELAYDARILRRPPVWERPWFWIAVGVGAFVVAGALVAVTYEPPVHTVVGF